MGARRESASASEFWRCGSCGTPNPRAAYLTHCLGCGGHRDVWGRAEAAPAPRPPLRRRLGRWLAASCWAYLAAVAVVAIVQNGLGDRWWPATMMLYGPRWVWGAPLALLVPAAIGARPGALIPLGLAGLLIAGPVLGGCVPWRQAFARRDGGTGALRVLSCNTQGGHLDPSALAGVIARVRPDLVFLQEWDRRHAAAVFRGPGWTVRNDGELGLASRFPIRRVEVLDMSDPELHGLGAAVRYVVETPRGPLLVANAHLETPREGLEAVRYHGLIGVAYLERTIELRRALSELVRRFVEGGDVAPALVAGDLNMTADGAIYRAGWSRYRNAFSVAGLGFGATRYTRWFGARIDHILAGPGWWPRRCRVGPDVGSDHRPLWAEIHRDGVAIEKNGGTPGANRQIRRNR